MNPRIARLLAIVAAPVAMIVTLSSVTAEEVYKKPPKEIRDVLNAPAIPGASLSPSRDYLLLVTSDRYPSIGELAQPMLRLAGLRINPKSNSPHPAPSFIEFTLSIGDSNAVFRQLSKTQHARAVPTSIRFRYLQMRNRLFGFC